MSTNTKQKQNVKTKKEKNEKKIIYYSCPAAKINCVCGNTIKTGSTIKETCVEICSACHPFYTGSQKFVDTGGRIEKFKQRMAKKEEMKKKKNKKK